MEHNGSIQQIPPGIRDISYSAVSGSTSAAPRQHQNCVIHLLLPATGAGRHQTVPVSANTTTATGQTAIEKQYPGDARTLRTVGSVLCRSVGPR